MILPSIMAGNSGLVLTDRRRYNRAHRPRKPVLSYWQKSCSQLARSSLSASVLTRSQRQPGYQRVDAGIEIAYVNGQYSRVAVEVVNE